MNKTYNALMLVLVVGVLYLVVFITQNNKQVSNLGNQVEKLSTEVSSFNDNVVDLYLSSVNINEPASGIEPSDSYGNVYYVDAINGSSSGDGSESDPWKSLQDVIDSQLIESQNWNGLPYNEGSSELIIRNSGAPVKAGDAIYLLDGNYGDVVIKSYYNKKPITIKNYPGHSPTFHSIKLLGVSNWIFDGLTIKRSDPYSPKTSTLFEVLSHGWLGPASNITLENSLITSADEVTEWSADDWGSKVSDGIKSNADHVVIRNNVIENVRYGLEMRGGNTLVEYNTINWFTGDGMRGLGDYGTYQYNLVKNSIKINNHHDDGFQSWSYGEGGVGTGVVKGVTVRGNTFIAFEDPEQPFRGYLQGIGCFNGPFEGWIVENNVAVVDTWHGISFNKITDSKIVNNTVIDIDDTTKETPWIMVRGMSSKNNVIRNNIASKEVVAYQTKKHENIVDNNIYGRKLNLDNFVDANNYDFRLRPDSEYINAGNPRYAPANDRDLKFRDRFPDIGAYEYR